MVIPVRNRRELLRETLEALGRQTFVDYEVIVVDDASSDGSAEVAQEEAACGRAVRVLHGRGDGAVAARLQGVAASDAELLAFTDSDCRPAPGWLAAGVAALEQGADVVQGLTRPRRPPRPLERSVWSTRDDGLYPTCNVFYRRSAYDAAGGFDPGAHALGFRPGATLKGLGFGEDTLLGWRVRRAGRAVFVAEAVVEHHVFGVDVRDSLRRAWLLGALPALLRAVPELHEVLGDELRKARRRRLPLYAAAVLAAGGRRTRPLAMATLGCWVALRMRAVRQAEPSRARALAVVPADAAIQAVEAVALVVGSVRARRLVL